MDLDTTSFLEVWTPNTENLEFENFNEFESWIREIKGILSKIMVFLILKTKFIVITNVIEMVYIKSLKHVLFYIWGK